MKKNAGNMVWYIIKLLLVGYIISGIILGVLALMMWKGNPAAGLISGGLLFAYLISCFVGGLLLGKKDRRKKVSVGAFIRASLFCGYICCFAACKKYNRKCKR